MKTLQNNFKSLLSSDSGSAMTEFVIGLPIFIMIFSGMGALYKLNHEALLVKAEANAGLWEEAEMGAGKIIPGGALFDVGSFGDVVQNGGSALGIYADSGIKTAVPLTLIPGSKPDSACFTVGCALGGAGSDYHSWILLGDNMVDGAVNGNLSASGWANVVSSALTLTGSRPSFAAGVRYGAVDFTADDRSVNTARWGEHSLQPGKLDIPGVTQPTHRALAVGLTRIEFAREEFMNVQVPEFDDEWRTEAGDIDGLDECSEQASAYDACQQDPEADCDAPSACEGIGGSNPLGSIGGDWCGGAVGCP